MAGEGIDHCHRLLRANLQAEAAALAGKGVDLELLDGVEATGINAETATSARLRVDNGYLQAPELVCLLHCRLEHQVEVGSIDIAVAEDLVVRQRR